jgi:hypothetical protein
MVRMLSESSFSVSDPEVIGLLSVFLFFFGNL